MKLKDVDQVLELRSARNALVSQLRRLREDPDWQIGVSLAGTAQTSDYLAQGLRTSPRSVVGCGPHFLDREMSEAVGSSVKVELQRRVNQIDMRLADLGVTV